MSSTFTGPIISNNGVKVGSAGSTIAKIKTGTVSVTVAADAAAAEEDITMTISGVAAGDIVIVQPPNAAAETGLAQVLCWISAANTVKMRLSNVNAAAALAGSTANWTYLWFDLT